MDRVTSVTAVTEVQAGRGPARDTVLLGKYRVVSTLGFGGMGLVIKAHNLALEEDVAIKLLRDDVQIDDDNITRFVREAKNAVKLKSEHVARIRDVGLFEDGRPYMVMELLDGLDLGKMLVDHGRIDRAYAVDLVLQVCDAIAEAHALGIVHRDIKPTNLFLAKRRDGTDLVKVLDFGISKAQMGPDLSLTQTSSMLGTPAYMSPEQMRSARGVDRRSDIWSLGTVLYELVEGRQPFGAENFAELCVMVSIEPHTPMQFAPELEPVIGRALAKKVEDRYQDVADLAFELGPFSSDPGRARRQIGKIFRTLGRQHPDGRDSTPIALPRYSSTVTRASTPAMAAANTAPISIRPQGRWKTLAVLLVLFGLGITAGVIVMTSGTDVALTPASDELADPDEGSSTLMSVEQPDAMEAATVVDAGVAEIPSDAGVGSAIKTVKVSKRPVRKPPVRKPPRVKQPPSTGAPPPVKPKCDPFDNPKGCR